MILERDTPHRLAQHKKHRDGFSITLKCLNSEPKGLFSNQKPSYFLFFATLSITGGPDKQKQIETLFCCSCKPVDEMPPIGCFPPALLFHLICSVLKDQLRQLDMGFELWGIIGWLPCNKLVPHSLYLFFCSLSSSLCFSSLIFLIKFAAIQIQQDRNVTEQWESKHLHCCYTSLQIGLTGYQREEQLNSDDRMKQ